MPHQENRPCIVRETCGQQGPAILLQKCVDAPYSSDEISRERAIRES